MAQKKKKSPAKKQNNGGTSTKTFPYELTIGMIVKNDVTNLKTCLETMQPLRDAISCQLIITDTGSTDGTREVAEEYADLLLDFEWIDDFAAARNTGVEKAEGRWFLYIDSDHEFDESILDVAKFLQTKESHTADVASLTIRNYTGYRHERHDFFDTDSPIMSSHERKKSFFKDRIHECIQVSDDCVFYDLSSFVIHHWGYIKENGTSKNDRNIPLILKLLEEDPYNQKQHLQLIYATSDLYAKKERIATAMGLISKNCYSTGNLFNIHLINAQNAVEMKDWARLDETATSVFSTPYPVENVVALELAGHLVNGAYIQNDYEKSIEHFKKFVKLYNHLQKEPNLMTRGTYSFQFTRADIFNQLSLQTINAAISLEKFDLANELMAKTAPYAFSTSVDHPSLAISLKLISKINNFSLLPTIYNKMIEDGISNDIELFRQAIYSSVIFDTEQQKNIAAVLSDQVFDVFTAFSALKAKDFHPDACTENIKSLVSEDDDLFKNSNYKDLLYGYIVTGEDPLDFIEKSTIFHLLSLLPSLLSSHEDLIPLVESAYNDPNFQIDSLKKQKLWAFLGLESSVIMAKEENKSMERIEKLFSDSNELLYDYTTQIYNPALISEMGVGLLPPEEISAYFLCEANKQKKTPNYATLLKKVLKISPSYHNVIMSLISSETHQNEFTALAQKVKETIETLLSAGDLAQARMLIDKYQSLSPNDPDLPNMLARCQ